MSDVDGLPKGWAKAKIGDLVELKNGYAFKPSDWQEDGLPIVRIQNLNSPEAAFNHFPGTLPDRFRIKDGDLLFAWSGTPGTSFGAHIWRGDEAWLNQHIFRVDFNSTFLDKRFLRLAINHNLDDYIFQAHGGAGLAHITKGKFESSEVLIAPLNEQRRIVAKIDELFSDLDAGVAALQRAKAKLKRYRAAVLKAAVEGRLTEQWRAQHVEAASCRFLEGSRESPPTRQDAASTEEDRPANDTLPLVGYFDPFEPVANLQGNLPHWRQEGVTYFVTFRLADSIPREKLDLWQRERDDWLRRHPPPHTKRQREEYSRLFVDRFHRWLDAGYGKCVLAQPAVRKIVVDALRCFENDRYLLREWVVMPNHVHVVVTLLPGYELSSVLHSWKSYTAKAINKKLARTGTLWQKESFDHIVRGPDELDRIEWYIHENPRMLPPDRFTLHCLHEPAPPVEAASCRFPDGPPSDSSRSPAPSSTASDESRVDSAKKTRQDAASTGETGAELLKRILKQRRCKWEQEQLAAYEKAGKKPPANWQQKYKEPAGPDETSLPALPEGWCWATMDQVISYLRNGVSQKPSQTPPGHRILRINAVRPMSVDMEEIRYYDHSEAEIADYLLGDGDLLFTRYNGSVDLLGVAGMVRGCKERTLHPDKLIRVKPVLGHPVSPYLELVSNVGVSRKHMQGRARTTAGQTGISGADIREMPIPLCSLAEQHQIILEVEQRLSLVQGAESQIAANLKRSSRLRQSILKRAFEGNLVPQDPDDEPASVLLEHLRSSLLLEKANGPSKGPKRARRRRVQSIQLSRGRSDK